MNGFVVASYPKIMHHLCATQSCCFTTHNSSYLSIGFVQPYRAYHVEIRNLLASHMKGVLQP